MVRLFFLLLALALPANALADGAPPTFDCNTGGMSPVYQAGDVCHDYDTDSEGVCVDDGMGSLVCDTETNAGGGTGAGAGGSTESPEGCSFATIRMNGGLEAGALCLLVAACVFAERRRRRA